MDSKVVGTVGISNIPTVAGMFMKLDCQVARVEEREKNLGETTRYWSMKNLQPLLKGVYTLNPEANRKSVMLLSKWQKIEVTAPGINLPCGVGSRSEVLITRNYCSISGLR